MPGNLESLNEKGGSLRVSKRIGQYNSSHQINKA